MSKKLNIENCPAASRSAMATPDYSRATSETSTTASTPFTSQGGGFSLRICGSRAGKEVLTVLRP